MAKTFECRHGGVVCREKIRGDDEEDVLRKAVEHAKEAHGIDLDESRTLSRYARSLIQTTEE
jgi:predicted small metal-binding protein